MSGTGSAVPVSAFLLLTLLWPFKEHDSLELRNCVSVSHRLVAVKGERPTKEVAPGANKRQLTNNRCGIITQSVGTRKPPSLKAQFRKILRYLAVK
jgi:hypothetical protein